MVLDIKGDLTVDELHKLREYNYETTKHMTAEERRALCKKGADELLEKLRLFREQNPAV